MWRLCRVKAIRIHEDGGPDVLRYEDAPDPVPGTGQVLIDLRPRR
jgi:NADPH:quinone reductase-like Zn-dependent oxidoreductase